MLKTPTQPAPAFTFIGSTSQTYSTRAVSISIISAPACAMAANARRPMPSANSSTEQQLRFGELSGRRSGSSYGSDQPFTSAWSSRAGNSSVSRG